METSAVVGETRNRKRFRLGTITVLAMSLLTLGISPPAQATTTILGPFPLITTTFDVGHLTMVPPTSNSPGSWSYTSSNPQVATFTGSTLNIHSTGWSNITATQAATGSYTERSRSTVLRVNPGIPKLGAFPPQSVSITARTTTLTPPTSTSDGKWSFTSSNLAIATIYGNKVTFLDGGNVLITATQASTNNWAAALTHMILTVVALDPKIGTFGDITIMKDSVGSLTLIQPTSLSPGPWTFTSSNPQVATISGKVLTPLALGTSTITASQAHWGDYGSASISMTLTVQAAFPKLGAFPDVTAAFNSASLSTVTLVPPSSNSLGAWTFASSDPTVAITNGAIATLLKPGTTTITATQGAMGSYGPSNPLSMTLTVVGTPTIGTWANVDKVVKDPDFSLTAPTSNSTGPWTFSSSDPTVINIVGNVAKVVGAGEATITATQGATPVWAQATVQMRVRVAGHIPTVGSFNPIVGGVGDSPIEIQPPPSNSSGKWIYTSLDKSIVTISGSTLTIVGVGTATITATQNAAGLYSQSNTVQTTVTGKPKPVVGDFPNFKITYGTIAPALVAPASTSTAPWSYKSSDPGVVTISDSIIQMRGIGTATISATQAGTTALAPITKTFTIEVVAPPGAKPVVKPTPKSTKKPVVKKSTVKKPVIKVSASILTIYVGVKGATAKIAINGVASKVGKNIVKAGVNTVVVTVAGKIVYKKVFTVKPLIKVSVAKRVITVLVKGVTAKITINGIHARVGKNTVKAGKRTVVITVKGKVVYRKTFTIK